MKLARIVFAGLSLSIAPVLGLQAHVNAGGAVPLEYLEWNGFRLADAAVAGLTAEQIGETLSIAVPQQSESLARDAYASEPLATSALFIIALSGGGSDEFKRDLLLAANRLERTNQLVSLALIQDAALRGDFEQTLQFVDQAARVHPELNATFAQALQATLAEPGAQALLVTALKEEPVWATSFWSAVPSEEPQLQRYLALRRAVGRVEGEAGAASLIRALVSAGRYKDAFERWRFAGGSFGQDTGFANTSTYPPLDWQLASSSGLNAKIAADETMTLFVGSGQSGELVRQLVTLEPGRYALEAELELEQGEGAVEVALQCVESAQAIGAPQALSEPAAWTVSRGDCKYAWLVLRADAAGSQVPLKARLRQVGFNKIG